MKKLLTKKLLQKYKPRLAVVYGSNGRKEAREAIDTVLSPHVVTFSSSSDDFLENLYSYAGGFLGIFKKILLGGFHSRILIMDVSSPSNEAYQNIKSILGLELAVIVPVGDIPSFATVFAGPERGVKTIAREASIAKKAIFILDDETVRDSMKEVKTDTLSIGYGGSSDIKIDAVKETLRLNKDVSGGTHMKVEYDGSLVPLNFGKAYGKKHAYAACCALAAAVHFDLNFITAAQDLANYMPPEGSLQVRKGVKNTALFSHTNNVTPYSAREAIELAGKMHASGMARRVVIIMGDIITHKEEDVESMHRAMGEFAARNCQEMFLAGERVVFVEEEAQKHGMLKSNIHRFTTAKEAAQEAQQHIKERDLVLILGSEYMHMEEAVKELIEI